MLRTHTCGQLNQQAIGQEVTLCGWVASRRDHGKLIFIDLRDRYGLTQVVFLPKPKELNEQAKKLRSEDVIQLKGVVNQRPQGTENQNLFTGLVEVVASELVILNSSADLPFVLDGHVEVGEETRLTYRYLDLRRKEMLERMVLRNKCNQAFRAFLDSQDFLEIETPFLTKSTPEGARDFLVPSRLEPGAFYALPQSPQLFKQILMVAGMDRYYQVARCFRDEDLRRDRQPEFTQLDIEMSFIQQSGIMDLMEQMLVFVFKQALGVELKRPFLRISYSQAMAEYKTDKPDIGQGDYRFVWVVDFPLFEYNQDEKRWQACHHPFTSPRLEDLPLSKDGDLSRIKAQAYDLILNGSEVAGGSIRINSSQLQSEIFDLLGISKEEAEAKFGFLLKAFQYGAPPHGGIAFGLDRLYAIISKAESIRDVIAFPKTQKGVCPLSNAPSIVNDKQLREVSIKVIEPKK